MGYILENIEWITNSLNSGLSSITRKNRNDVERKVAYKVLGIK